MSQLSAPEIERLARKRAGAKMGWYIHATIFVLANALFFAFSHFGFGHRQWTVFPVLGWGVGLLLHGVSVFMIGSGSRLRESLVQRERERLRREQERP